MTTPILTDAKGRPFDRPEPPGPDATSDERGAYIRARNEYNDRVTDCANRAFADAFNARVKAEARERGIAARRREDAAIDWGDE